MSESPDGFYRKKTPIQARQFISEQALGEWANDPRIVFKSDGSACLIATLEGTMRAARGDWICLNVTGEFYSCKPDVFEQTYEPINAKA